MIFDFDGVILDSESYKIQIFKSLFASFPDKVEEIDHYNRANRGISRFVKFEHIYKNILKLSYNEDLGKKLGEEYGQKVSKNVHSIKLIKGVADFLAKQQALFFIASSAPASEVDKILSTKNILQFFKEIYGYPVPKSEAVQRVLEEFNLFSSEILFIGDAPADFEVAKERGVDFLARTENPKIFPEKVNFISDFSQSLF